MFALLAAGDEFHDRAAAALGELRLHDRLVTHNYVVLETSALVQQRLGATAVRELHDHLLLPVEVVWIDQDLHSAAVTSLLAAGRREISLVDWVSFELMRRTGITTAFAFDPDFLAYGFTLVP